MLSVEAVLWKDKHCKIDTDRLYCSVDFGVAGVASVYSHATSIQHVHYWNTR